MLAFGFGAGPVLIGPPTSSHGVFKRTAGFTPKIPSRVAPPRDEQFQCRPGRRSGRIAVHMAMPNRRPSRPGIAQRLLATVVYLIPFLDVLAFGSYVFGKIPLLHTVILQPLLPLWVIYRRVPFLSFALFLVVYFYVGKNSNFSYFVRYNAHQAILLDITIILPQLLFMFQTNIPPFVEEAVHNAIFYIMIGAVGYSISKVLRGLVPRDIPLVSDAVENQVGSSGAEDD